MKRPLGVTLIACFCLLAGVYLCSIGVIQILIPGVLKSLRYAPNMGALRQLSPYLTLAIGTCWALVSWGLFRLWDWARLAAAIMLGAGAIYGTINAIFYHYSTSRYIFGSVEIVLRLVATFYLMALIDTFAKQEPQIHTDLRG